MTKMIQGIIHNCVLHESFRNCRCVHCARFKAFFHPQKGNLVKKCLQLKVVSVHAYKEKKEKSHDITYKSIVYRFIFGVMFLVLSIITQGVPKIPQIPFAFEFECNSVDFGKR